MARKTVTKAKKTARVAPSGPPARKQAVAANRPVLPLLTTETPAALTQQGEPSEAKVILDSEDRWNRLLAREPDALADPAVVPAAETAPPPQTAEDQGWIEHRALWPLRPETKAEEVARYQGRLARYEEAQRIAESRKGHEREDAEHREACLVGVGCEHPSHVAPRRPLSSETRRDRNHLGSCDLEEGTCPTDDDSHLLPPHPIEVTQEFCCAHRCFPRSDRRSITDCVYLETKVGRQRRRDSRRFGKAAFARPTTSAGGEASVVVTRYLNPETTWGL